jgi:uncharacterized protein YndB with AHSA1/START domain
MAEATTSIGDAASASPELTITRSFKAPPSLVFKAWTRPEHLVRWLGPKEFRAHDIALDVREGGSWRACITGPDGDENWMGGRYREISPPDRLVFTFAWDSTGFESVVTITLAADGDQTAMTFHQAPFASVESRDSHNQGWSSSFDRLAALVAELAG